MLTKRRMILVLGFGLSLTAACAPATQAEKDAIELEKIREIAVDTCGSKDQVESVRLDGFVCKDN